MVRKNNNKVKKGFTIIEVVLVLAIAGLIFLMVFIALPALQRSQRNTQRRDDYSMLVTAVNSYMSSNNGKLTNLIKNNKPTSLNPARWINSTGEDPNGNPYELIVYSGIGNADAEWEKTDIPLAKHEDAVAYCSTDTTKTEESNCPPNKEGGGSGWVNAVEGSPGSQVFVIIHADCSGEPDQNGDPTPGYDTAARSFAVYGYLEGGGFFCQASGSAQKDVK